MEPRINCDVWIFSFRKGDDWSDWQGGSGGEAHEFLLEPDEQVQELLFSVFRNLNSQTLSSNKSQKSNDNFFIKPVI